MVEITLASKALASAPPAVLSQQRHAPLISVVCSHVVFGTVQNKSSVYYFSMYRLNNTFMNRSCDDRVGATGKASANRFRHYPPFQYLYYIRSFNTAHTHASVNYAPHARNHNARSSGLRRTISTVPLTLPFQRLSLNRHHFVRHYFPKCPFFVPEQTPGRGFFGHASLAACSYGDFRWCDIPRCLLNESIAFQVCFIT